MSGASSFVDRLLSPTKAVKSPDPAVHTRDDQCCGGALREPPSGQDDDSTSERYDEQALDEEERAQLRRDRERLEAEVEEALLTYDEVEDVCDDPVLSPADAALLGFIDSAEDILAHEDMLDGAPYLRGGDADESGAGLGEGPVARNLAGHGAYAHNGTARAARGTVAWYVHHRKEPVFEGAAYTVEQVALGLLEETCSYVVKDTPATRFCTFVQHAAGGDEKKNNFWPRSLYICKGIVAVTKAAAFEHHCCSTPDCPIVFEDLPDNSVETREARFDERCPKCAARRFERVGGQIQAVQRYWDRGFGNQVVSFYCDKEVARFSARSRNYKDPTSIFSSRGFKALDQRCRGQIRKGGKHGRPRVLCVEGGGDGVQAHGHGVATCTVIGLRNQDLPAHLAHTDRAFKAWIAVSSPEKTNMAGILNAGIQEAKCHAPPRAGEAGKPLRVFNAHTQQEEHIYTVMTGFLADTPFTAHVSGACGHSCRHGGCRQCFISGVSRAADNTKLGSTRFVGYAATTPSQRFSEAGVWEDVEHVSYNKAVGAAPPAFDTDVAARLRLTDHQHRLRVKLAETMRAEEVAKRPLPNETNFATPGEYEVERQKVLKQRREAIDDGMRHLGCRGWSPFSQLYYFRYDDFFRIPVGHASVLGVIKPFWEQHLRPAKTTLDTGDDIRITTAQRATMKERHRQLVSTSCYNINLPDIVSNRSQMTMSDWVTWSEVVAPYVLHDSGVDQRILDMWHELRTGLLYFLRYHPGQHSDAAIDAAQNHLLRYAALVERNYGIARKALVTHQLHVVCVHFAEQAKQWGPLAFAGEWWVERLMQRFKRITKYRTTRYPVLVAVNFWLTQDAVLRYKQRHPEVAAGMRALVRTRVVNRDVLARQDEEAGVLLHGPMRTASQGQRDAVVAAIEAVSKLESQHDRGSICGHLDPEVLAERSRRDGAPTITLETARAASLRSGQLLVRPRKGTATTGTRDDLMFLPYQVEGGGACLCVLEISDVYRAVVPAGRSVQLALAAAGDAGEPGGNEPERQSGDEGGAADAAPSSCSSSSADADAIGEQAAVHDPRAEVTVRFAVGTLHELEVVAGKGLSTEYCEGPVGGDGAGPARAWPTLMRRRSQRSATDAVSYPWAALLSKGEGPMVSAERGRYVVSFVKSAAHA